MLRLNHCLTVIRVLPIALPFALVACSGGSDTGTSSGSPTGSGGAGGGAAIPCNEPQSLSVSGTWAARGRLAVKLQGVPGGAISICPADQVGDAEILLFATMDQSGTSISNVKASLCYINLPVTKAIVGDCDPTSPSLVETQIQAPDAFLNALPSVANAAVTGKLGGTTVGSTVSFDPFQVTIGSTAAGDAMPKWDTTASACDSTDVGFQMSCQSSCVSDCTSLRDDDNDGYPGVTMYVCGFTASDNNSQIKCNASSPSTPGSTIQGQGYIDLQVNPQFTGEATSSCELKGTIGSQVLYNLVGGNIYLSGAPITVTSAIKSLPAFQVDPTQSAFRMVRVDGQYGAPDWKVDATNPSAACQAIVAHKNDL